MSYAGSTALVAATLRLKASAKASSPVASARSFIASTVCRWPLSTRKFGFETYSGNQRPLSATVMPKASAELPKRIAWSRYSSSPLRFHTLMPADAATPSAIALYHGGCVPLYGKR